jgi:hypothetical protein
MVKRVLGSCFVLLLLVALVAPAAASAKKKQKIYHLNGTVAGGGTIIFDEKVKKQGGEWVPKRVANFDFDEVPITCDSGSFTHSRSTGTDRAPFPVQDGLFSFQFLESPTSVEGSLTHKGKQAAGTYEALPDALDGETNCFTPKLNWSAQKTGTHNKLPRR